MTRPSVKAVCAKPHGRFERGFRKPGPQGQPRLSRPMKRRSLFCWMRWTLLAAVCPYTTAADQVAERLTVTITSTVKGDYSRNWSEKGTSVTETDHVEVSCTATMNATAPAGTPLSRMPSNGAVTCTASGHGSGTTTRSSKENGTHSYSASWEYKPKNPGQKLQQSVLRFGEPGSFTIDWPSPSEVESKPLSSPPAPGNLGDAMFNSVAALSVIPVAVVGVGGAVRAAVNPYAPGHNPAFLANLASGYDVKARVLNKSGSASQDYTRPDAKDGSTLTGSIRVDYTLSYNGKPAVRILKPADGTRRVFGLAADGSTEFDSALIIAAEASVSPPELASQLVWTVEPARSSTIEVKNQDGGRATITLMGLPQDNADFGPKKLTARAGDAEDSVTVELFYRREARDHDRRAPSTEPNWSFYWRQTAAAQGHTSKIVYDPNCPKSEERIEAQYRGGDSIYICDFSDVGGFSYLGQAIKGFSCEGIDKYAVLVGHEWEHRRQYFEWWGGGKIEPFYDCTPAQKADPANCDKTVVPGKVCDCDSDGIPDRLESGLGLNSHHTQTKPPNDMSCGDDPDDDTKKRCNDSHWLAYKAGESWAVGSADKEDWSYPGRQWPLSRSPKN
jgi:hypothetical protein